MGYSGLFYRIGIFFDGKGEFSVLTIYNATDKLYELLTDMSDVFVMHPKVDQLKLVNINGEVP
jgi:hypothetical protein